MTDWKSVNTIIQCALALYKAGYVLLGLYTWEWATSLRLELELVTGKRKFKWPMLSYFICRYLPCVYIAVFIAQAEAVRRPVYCGAIYTLSYFSSQVGIAFASFNLSLRALALWDNNRYVKMIVIAVFLGHLALIGAISPFSFRSVWIIGIGCSPGDQNLTGTIVILVYVLVFDLMFLVLALHKLLGTNGVSVRQKRRGRLGYVLFTQGISYFAITSVLNVSAVTLFVIDLNPVMAGIISTPAAVLIPLIACRMVRGLTFAAHADVIIETDSRTRDTGYRSSLQFKKRYLSQYSHASHK